MILVLKLTLSFHLTRLAAFSMGIILVIFTPGCGSTANISLEPRQEFILGGQQPDLFRVKMKNIGNVPVLVSEQLDHGEILSLGQLSPGDRSSLKVLSQSAIELVNPSEDTARIKLRVWGSESVQRRYHPPQ